MLLLLSSLEQSLLLLPLVWGIYISYRLLQVTDLTVDGTFVLGAAVFARSLEFGLETALTLSLFAGILTGLIVSGMQRQNKVEPLVVGILCAFMLYSVNLNIMGRPYISTLGMPSFLSRLGWGEDWLFPLLAINGLLMISLILVMKSPLGLLLRAFGYHQKVLIVLGKSVERYRLIGLALSNLLAACSGVLTCQVNGFAEINMGLGNALISIGAIVIGRHLFLKKIGKFSPLFELLACALGIFLYFLCFQVFLRVGIDPANLKFVLGLSLFFTLWNVGRKREEPL